MLRNRGFRQFGASAKYKVGDIVMYGTNKGTTWIILASDDSDYAIKTMTSARPEIQPVGAVGTSPISSIDSYYTLVSSGGGKLPANLPATPADPPLIKPSTTGTGMSVTTIAIVGILALVLMGGKKLF